jgi:polyadenylate-binding protein
MASPPYQTASLYVGDLHPTVTEALLFEIFKAVGPVASIRVCRDAHTRRSLGYAYVNFHNHVDAERALDSLNYTPIKGKPCRIMWSHRDPSVRKSGQGNIFIKNLDKSIDNKDLYDTFSTFGNILSCKVVTDGKGNSKGYGFVHYETQEAAEAAIKKVNGMLLNGKIVYVGPFIPKKERLPGSDPAKFTNLYVKNIPLSWGDDELKKHFEEIGKVTSAVVMTDGEKSRGFGFINYDNHEHAVLAIEKWNGEKLADAEKPSYVGRAMKKGEREDYLRKLREERAQKYAGINLYIKNLDDSVDNVKLEEAFKPYGSITSAQVMMDEKKENSRGFGFVCFTSPEEASKAVTEMNGAMLAGKPIYVALAERRDVRRAKLEAQHAARAAARMAPNVPTGPLYSGIPMFGYPGAQGGPQAQRQGFVYPQGMPVRRWAGPPGGAGAAGAGQQYQPVPYGMVPVPGGNPGRRPAGGRGQPPQASPAAPQYQYTKTARNNEQMPNGVPPQQQGQQGQPQAGPTGVLTASMLAEASPEERKRLLGESLYPLIAPVKPVRAGKITGMLLESLEVTELLHLLESPNALRDKIEEAVEVLNVHESKENEGDETTSGGEPNPVEANA